MGNIMGSDHSWNHHPDGRLLDEIIILHNQSLKRTGRSAAALDAENSSGQSLSSNVRPLDSDMYCQTWRYDIL